MQKRVIPVMDTVFHTVLTSPFIDNAFEVAYLKHVIHNLPLNQHRKAINEAKRVTKNLVIIWDIVNDKEGSLKLLMSFYWKILDGGYKYRTLTEWRSLLQSYQVIEERITGRGRSTYILIIEVCARLKSRL